jgi:multisite-specific tRNA:(cytosine-C5)-methyltransferase
VHVAVLIHLIADIVDKPSSLREQLHLTSAFPSSNVLVRNPIGDAVRAIYLSNDIGRSIVQNNDYTRLRLLTCGTKLFVKQGVERSPDAQFRILSEGLPAAMPYIRPETVLAGDLASLRVLMASYYPLCSTLPKEFRARIEDEREWRSSVDDAAHPDVYT